MEKYYLAALAHYLGMAAPQKAATLAALFGSAQRAHQAGKGAVRRLGVSNALVEYYGSRYQENFPETLLAYCQDHKVNIITRKRCLLSVSVAANLWTTGCFICAGQIAG